MNKNKIIYELYKLLDDIDTTSDMYKDSCKARCEHIDKLHKKRFDILNKRKVDKLYDNYYIFEKDILFDEFSQKKGDK